MLALEIHTDDPSLQQLCHRYWERGSDGWAVTVATVAREFSLQSQDVLSTVRDYSTAFDTEVVCAACGGHLVVLSRSRYPISPPADGLCSPCRRVRTERERLEAQERLDRQRGIILWRYALADSQPIDVEQLSFTQSCALLAVLRIGAAEDYTRILSMAEWERPLSPRPTYSYGLVEELWKAGILAIGPDSQPDAFVWDGDDPHQLYVPRVEWCLAGVGPHPQRVSEAISDVTSRFREAEWPTRWAQTWRSSWHRLMHEELLAYLEVSLAEHDLPFHPGAKTHDVLDYVLEAFSLGQAYNFVWGATRDAAAYWMRERIPKQRAANSVVGRIRSRAERALADGWDVKHYRRDRRCPPTAIWDVMGPLALQVLDPFPITPSDVHPPGITGDESEGA